MRFVLVFCSLLASCGGMRGPTPIAQPSDVESVDAIMHSVYDVISGPVNAPRDWNRFRSLFVADARMIPIGLRKEGGYGSFTLTVEDYINRASAHFEKEAFYEKEISRKTEQFAHFAHVLSTYASYHDTTGGDPFMRGINSFQLMNDGKRWWVVTILWEAETKENPIPASYLPEGTP